MILILQIEKLGAHLDALSPLMDRYQRGDQTFADEVLKWLDEAEKTMSMLRLPEGAELSVLRGRILRSGDSALSSKSSPPRSTLRRVRNVAAAEALERAEEIMRGRLLEAENRLKFFEEKFCEGITHFMASNELPDMATSYDNWLNQVWVLMRNYEKTRPLILYISASLSPSDRSIIMDRVLNRATQKDVGCFTAKK